MPDLGEIPYKIKPKLNQRNEISLVDVYFVLVVGCRSFRRIRLIPSFLAAECVTSFLFSPPTII